MDNFTSSTSTLLNTSECHPVDSTSRRRTFIFFYLFIILASIPLNCFFLYVSWQHIRQKNELGIYLFNLALSDLTFTFGLSMWLEFLWRGIWGYGGLACVLSIYCLFTNFYMSDALLCCIAFDRYLAVVHPFKYKFVRNINTAICVSFTMWVLVLIFNARTISTEDSNQDEASLCFDILQPLTLNMARANILRFVLGFVVPLLVVFFSTWGIFRAVRTNQATQEQESKRVAKLLLTVLLCLVISFGPIHMVMLVRTLVKDCMTIQSLLYPHKIAIAFSCLNCLADPLLYCFITRTGKAQLHRVVLYFRNRRRTAEVGETMSVHVQTNPGGLG
ncbi:psychosine receptor-like [Periophthalmus magnuspinnatus]|uniref:psychosine receptor-like n=1 Tax=Periophthalmus magnuspinnatus TaxID=409849 RepID=UPI00145BC206|nr:psychosine receptor-like [Periophthalmus magnuspinnatus]